ncbi:Arsenite methyltransferase [Lachnellula suecica]|uniref:Arsenite methyltransferase n=1 Tax=Lachnellula suecica TaxID=602035 RepID=A0A8T9BXT9_9HELO|nr:Arsenite methyltransferase [Lachnellula suecica]
MPSITTQAVVDHYSSLALDKTPKNSEHSQKVAESFGYAASDLTEIPSGANLGVSCGNPLAIASLKPGEVVLDLGSGAGFDVFQAARKVGPHGLAIGIDMSVAMLDRANKNAAKSFVTNVQFILAPITDVPLQSQSVDCAISNCVINLLPSPEKLLCFKEVHRLLKAGGRLAISDILAKKEFPEELKRDMGLYVGCISGASLVSEYEGWLKGAGFQEQVLDDEQSATPSGISGSKADDRASCCSPAELVGPSEETSERVADIDFNEWVSELHPSDV